jgi:hypothetical protein
MSEEMGSFHVRVDKDFYDILTRKSKERGIRIGRYIRMLIERGLVIDHQYHNEGTSYNLAVNNHALLPIIAELCAETTMLVRYLYREKFDNDDAFKDMVSKIYSQSQQLLEMMKMAQDKTHN